MRGAMQPARPSLPKEHNTTQGPCSRELLCLNPCPAHPRTLVCPFSSCTICTSSGMRGVRMHVVAAVAIPAGPVNPSEAHPS